MAVKISNWSAMPEELRGHEYDKAWTKKGQRVAERMYHYICDTLVIPEQRRPPCPRVVVYKAKVTRKGNRKLPMMDAAAVFYMNENYIAARIPKAVPIQHVKEYKFLKPSPVIGECDTTRWNSFKIDIAHEMAHWVVDRVLRKSTPRHHGRTWRVAYALLRERFC